MTRPFISVCAPTNRVGGIDVLVSGLAGQTFREFELVLSDSLFRHRPNLAQRVRSEYGLNFKHVEPRTNRFPENAFSAVANEALAHATGEIVVMLVDYTWLPPDCLQAHADFHASHDRKSGLMLPHNYYELPPVSPAFPSYGNPDTFRYVEDLEAGRLDPCMWSILADPVKPGHVFSDLDKTGYANIDPKLKFAEGSVPASYFHGKNESVPRDALMEVNGWDEALDGGHGYQDTDLAERLNEKAGIQWMLLNAPVAQIINPRRIFPFPVRPRSVAGNEAVWRAAKAAGYPPVNAWSLRDG